MTSSDAIVANLTWDGVAERIPAGAVAVLPIGAGAKQHGLHMPMATDQIQAEWLASQLAKRLEPSGVDCLIWPCVTYGYYPAFIEYPGSVTLSHSTFSAMVKEIVMAIQSHGIGMVMVIDTGISTLKPVADALASISGAHHCKIHHGSRYCRVASDLRQQKYGSHADELETARMLCIAPDRVMMSRGRAALDEEHLIAAGPLKFRAPESANYSPSGSIGDPTLATLEKGQALTRAMLDDLVFDVIERLGI